MCLVLVCVYECCIGDVVEVVVIVLCYLIEGEYWCCVIGLCGLCVVCDVGVVGVVLVRL